PTMLADRRAARDLHTQADLPVHGLLPFACSPVPLFAWSGAAFCVAPMIRCHPLLLPVRQWHGAGVIATARQERGPLRHPLYEAAPMRRRNNRRNRRMLATVVVQGNLALSLSLDTGGEVEGRDG